MKLLNPLVLATAVLVAGQQVHIQSDPGAKGPKLEIAHLYYDQFPTGIAVSSQGRMFTTYPASLYAKNAGNYTLAELTSNTTETPYPSLEYNNPPGGRLNKTTSPATAAAFHDHLISVQGIVIDAFDRLWLLDNARIIDSEGTQVPASPGGPKIVGIDLATNKVFTTLILPSTAVYPDSYLNDFRIDLRPSLTAAGKGVAYITDSSANRGGIVIVDLGTGEAWNHLSNDPRTKATQQHFVSVWGEPVYFLTGPDQPFGYDNTGADGLALSADGETLYWSVTGSRLLFSIPTKRLLDRSTASEAKAQRSVNELGEKGASDGIDSDSNDLVYVSSFEQNGINVYNPDNATVTVYVRDPRLGWIDALVAGPDGYLYITENQLWRTPTYYPDGKDRTVKPLVLFRVPLAGNGTRVALH